MIAEKPVILIADDDENFREIFSTQLTAAGFEVVAVEDGVAALKKLAEIHPALLLLDVEMPGESGFEILQKIKADPRLAHVKVAFLTNLGNSDRSMRWTDEKFAREVGALDYIKKTDDLENITAHVQDIISGKNVT